MLQRPGCFVWVALRDATDDELRLMQAEFDLHELAVEDARHGHQRPKIEEYGATLFVVMQLPSRSKAASWREGEVAIFAGPNFVLSVRNNSRQGFLGVRERCEREPEHLRQGAGFVLYALMDAVVDRYFPVLDTLESELEQIEEPDLRARCGARNIQRLYELKRRVTVLRHAVAPLAGGQRASCTAGACRRCAMPQRRSTSATCTTTWRASTPRHRRHPRHHRHRHPGQPVDGDDRGVGDHQAPGRLGRDLRRVDRAGRHLGHELRAHARARLGAGATRWRWARSPRAAGLLYLALQARSAGFEQMS
jgi:hypothetical protein